MFSKRKWSMVKSMSPKAIERLQLKKIVGQIICSCRKAHCGVIIDIDRQLEIFDNYWKKFNWSQKSSFVRSSVKSKARVYRKSDHFPIVPRKKRSVAYDFTFLDSDGVTQKSCKTFFLKCLQITSARDRTENK